MRVLEFTEKEKANASKLIGLLKPLMPILVEGLNNLTDRYDEEQVRFFTDPDNIDRFHPDNHKGPMDSGESMVQVLEVWNKWSTLHQDAENFGFLLHSRLLEDLIYYRFSDEQSPRWR